MGAVFLCLIVYNCNKKAPKGAFKVFGIINYIISL